jgi:hypothetical protein
MQLVQSHRGANPNLVTKLAKRTRGVENVHMGLGFPGSKHCGRSSEAVPHAAGLAADHCQMALFGR